MAYITRIVYRHTHAIQSQVTGALGMTFKAMMVFDLREWLNESAPKLVGFADQMQLGDDICLKHANTDGIMVQNYAMALNSAIMAFDASQNSDWGRAYFIDSIRSTSAGDHAGEDYYGTDLGGEWDIPNFIIRSGIILLLGALEEFERGTLRILCKKLGDPDSPNAFNELFIPRLADYQGTSERYENLERSRALQTVSRRHRELRQYGIDADADTEWNRLIGRLRRSRNTIAHGEAALVHPFQDFLDLNYSIYRATSDIAEQAKQKLNIAL